ncbi:MAG TPA: HAD family hydrolase, partial [Anaerolineales bacterium]|nr:HAD family hydrolase [Anaerolineales bacterium]
MGESVRAIVLDLDGTLLTPELEISEEDLRALDQARLAGMLIIIATGRPLASVTALFPNDSPVDYFVCSNGGAGFVVGQPTPIYTSYIQQKTTEQLIEVSRKFKVPIALYGSTEWYVESDVSQVVLEISRSKSRPISVKDVTTVAERVVKAMYISENASLLRLIEAELKAGFASTVGWYYSYPEYLEVSPFEGGKLRAVDAILRSHKIPWEAVIAVGDGDNDIPLLKTAGIGVAMGNSSELVKSHA